MKIILTEGQVARIKSINEGQEDQYNAEVNARVNFFGGSKYKNFELSDVNNNYKIRLYYNIDINYRSWGIDGINVTNIVGPKEIDIEVIYYVPEIDDNKSEYLKAFIDWSNVNIDIDRGNGMISIDDNVELTLAKGEDGNIIISENGYAIIKEIQLTVIYL